MAKYWIGFTDFTTSTTPKTAMKLIGAATTRHEIVDIALYGSGVTAAADVQHEVQFGYLSNAGAGTAAASPTPEKKDPASPASALTAGTGYSAEPTTYATNTFPLFAFNQRGGMRWYVLPGDGFMNNGSATSLSSGVRTDCDQAGKVSGNMHWVE